MAAEVGVALAGAAAEAVIATLVGTIVGSVGVGAGCAGATVAGASAVGVGVMVGVHPLRISSARIKRTSIESELIAAHYTRARLAHTSDG